MCYVKFVVAKAKNEGMDGIVNLLCVFSTLSVCVCVFTLLVLLSLLTCCRNVKWFVVYFSLGLMLERV
jgi:hypothetical protein